MKKRIQEYVKYIDKLLEESPEGTDWDHEIEKHLNQIAFFQHERLVHLIVFALVVKNEIMILPLIILLFVLLVPYCMHYYLLENSVQKMYDQYDAMINKKESYFKV